jgi:serine protease Do
MDSSEPRGICPHCAEPVALSARLCPHCRQGLLVDLRLTGPLPSARDAYGAARALEALAPAELTFLTLKRSLDSGGGVVLSGVTQALASRGAEVIHGHGGTTEASAHAPAPTSAERSGAGDLFGRRGAVVVGASVVVVAIGVVGWLGLGRSPEASSSRGLFSSGRQMLDPRQVGALAAEFTAALRCGSSTGSGFFVGAERLVTSAHVLCGDDGPLEITLSDGRQLEGRVESRDDWLDVALVEVAGAEARPVALGDASSLTQGDPIFVYGSPRGLEFTLSQGIVSHPARALQGIAYVQVDANVNPGNSGGPLLTAKGEVVGIVTMVVGEGSGLGLALPVNYLYEGERSLVPRPGSADRRAWERLLIAATERDTQDVARLIESLERPVLAGAFLAGGRQPMAIVLRLSDREPWWERFQFRLEEAGGDVLCDPQGETGEWHSLVAEEVDWLDERTRRWLDHHRLEIGAWGAMVRLDWEGCPPASAVVGRELVLTDADPSWRRATFQGMPLPGM